jgi:hypothetical protein
MDLFFKELVQVYKKEVRIKQIKKRSIENFCRFYSSFVDQHKDPKDKDYKYLKLKQIGLKYILDNQDLIYSEINK